MMFNRGLFQKFEQLKARHIEQSEFTAKELNSVRKRISTLEKQVADEMNREEEWKRRLSKIEWNMLREGMVKEGLIKEEVEFEPRVGDLVCSKKDERDIRKVCANGYGFLLVGRDFRTVYTKDSLVKDLMSEWKVIARREDLK